jgi:hypothetical protein
VLQFPPTARALPFSPDLPDIFLADSVTKLPAEAAGHVVVSGSHGGGYPGFLAAVAGVRGIILNDAGVGKDAAGISALPSLERIGIAAATVSHLSCRIGLANDIVARGIISHTNAPAHAAGVRGGDSCRDAALTLRMTSVIAAEPIAFGETRSELVLGGVRRVILIDSASLVEPEDRGAIVVTGSHGGLVGGSAAAALRVDAFAALFNDAGFGMDDAGVARLAPLDDRGIAAFTVAAASARIGEAHSTYADGIVSRTNQTAKRLGVREGDRAAAVVERLASV